MKRKLSLFKYPGGKSRIVDEIRAHIDPVVSKTKCYNEVFIGGGPILLDIANDPKFADIKLRANDLDTNVYAFWNILANGSETEFGNLIDLLSVNPTVDLFYQERSKQPKEGEQDNRDELTRAYHCVFFHKTTFNGMYKARPIGGEKQGKWKIDCHYDKSGKLISRIEEARRRIRNRLEVSSLSAIDFITTNTGAMYLDPPYYKAGKSLYSVYMKEEEHRILAEILKNKEDWVLSYDDCEEVRKLYNWANVDNIVIWYSSSSFNKRPAKGIRQHKTKDGKILTKEHGICSTKSEIIIKPLNYERPAT